MACDLLAVDQAYPEPVADDDIRTRAHLAWRHGQVLLIEYEGRLTLAVPGTPSPPTCAWTRSAGWPRRSAPPPTASPSAPVGADRHVGKGREF